MARPYSVDLRARVVHAVEAGLSRRAAAAKYEVSVSFVVKLLQRCAGAVRCGPSGSAARSARASAAEPDLMIAELRSRLAAEGIAVSRSSLGRFLIAAGLTRRRSTPPSRTAPTSPPRGSPGARASRR